MTASLNTMSDARSDENEVAKVTGFWRQAGPGKWFARKPAFDARFRERFLDLHYAAARRECDHWIHNSEGALALLLLLDQFPRNAYRGTAHMYATDPLALQLADSAQKAGRDCGIEPELRLFLYLPFAHSENLVDQDRSVALNRRLGAWYEEHACAHRHIIRRLRRFPHRNALLGRETTPEERRFLAEGGFAG
jgi:uncharacterized protein (DUF924 family)